MHPTQHPQGPIYVAGHRGMVGAAIVRALKARGYEQIITRTHAELDLTRQALVEEFFAAYRPARVFLAAAKVGGIHANDSFPADFIYDNLMIEANAINAAWRHGVERLLFLGSSCIYPRLCEQPMAESALLSGALEPTNEPYAIAKIAGLKLCESFNRQHGTDFRSVMPTNLYGPGDNFDLANSHVIPALIRKFHEAKVKGADHVMVWGSGMPRREFLHVDDMAAACLYVMDLDVEAYRAQTQPRLSHINVGAGTDITIAQLAELIADVVGFRGGIRLDATKPDGAPRKLLDVSRLVDLGWQPRIALRAGLEQSYEWFVANQTQARQ